VSSPDPSVHHATRPAASPASEALEEFDVDQPFDGASLYGLRETLAAHAGRLGADEDQIDCLLIVASELATNAVRHGGGAGHVRLWHRHDVLFCEVSDRGPGITDPAVGSTLPDPTDGEGGRGLWICRRLSTQLSIEARPDGHGAIVTAAIPSQGHQEDTGQ
jgi:anti-sigma regulatory factor (Ser/Thr protein kinase)